MATDIAPEFTRQKVAAVREVVPDRSKHEISLVLTHFDHNVEQTIQAFIENGARDVLEQWQSTAASNKLTNKKKKKPKKDTPPGVTVVDDGPEVLVQPTRRQQEPMPQRPNQGPNSNKRRNAGTDRDNPVSKPDQVMNNKPSSSSVTMETSPSNGLLNTDQPIVNGISKATIGVQQPKTAPDHKDRKSTQPLKSHVIHNAVHFSDQTQPTMVNSKQEKSAPKPRPGNLDVTSRPCAFCAG